MKPSAVERVMARVEMVTESGCWVWMGNTCNGGYGQVRLNGRLAMAHRVVYEATHGAIHKSLKLDHLCRVRSCVNPNHLDPVTNAENTWRGARAGELHSCAKLNTDAVREIRSCHQQGALAKKFGVSRSAIHQARSWHTWAHVL